MSSIRVLFVGDDLIGKIIKKIMSKRGDTVDIVCSVKDAESALLVNKYDLLITEGRIQKARDAGLQLIEFSKKTCLGIKTVLVSILHRKQVAFEYKADGYWSTNGNFYELVAIADGLFTSHS